MVILGQNKEDVQKVVQQTLNLEIVKQAHSENKPYLMGSYGRIVIADNGIIPNDLQLYVAPDSVPIMDASLLFQLGYYPWIVFHSVEMNSNKAKVVFSPSQKAPTVELVFKKEGDQWILKSQSK